MRRMTESCNSYLYSRFRTPSSARKDNKMPRILIRADQIDADSPVKTLKIHLEIRPCGDILKNILKDRKISSTEPPFENISKNGNRKIAIKTGVPEKRTTFWIMLWISEDDTANIGNVDWARKYILDNCLLNVATHLDITYCDHCN